MNCRTFREQLADLVAGELDLPQRAAAHEHMQTCEQCRELARGLETAATVVEAGVVSLDEAERQTAALTPPAPVASNVPVRRLAGVSDSAPDSAVRRYRLSAIVRYAAVILLAFASGYSARGWRAGEVASSLPPDDRASPVSSEFAQRYAIATEQFPDSSTFSHSLVALARR